jgi:hypothetical protein
MELSASRRFLSLAHPVALSFRGDDRRVVREPIEERGRELLVARENGHPFGEGQIRRDDDAAPLVAFGDEIEEELATGTVERDEAELVDDQELDVVEATMQPRELAMIACLDERADEIGGACEEDAATAACRFDAESDREVGLSRPDRPSEDQILGACDPLAARELGDDRRTHRTVGGGEVEGVERLELREAGVVDAVADRGLEPRRLLRREDLVQVVLVRPVLLTSVSRERLVRSSEPRHLEIARLGGNQLLGDRGATHSPPPRSHSS